MIDLDRLSKTVGEDLSHAYLGLITLHKETGSDAFKALADNILAMVLAMGKITG